MSESIRRLTRIGAAALTLCLAQVLPARATATDLPEYTIRRASGPIAIDGLLDESSWSAAATVGDCLFPWYRDGDKEQTEGRMLWDEKNLYVSFVARDKHISAVLTERFGGVHFTADTVTADTVTANTVTANTVTAGDDTSGVELER